eukprot:798116-Rhodomonas_salina.1
MGAPDKNHIRPPRTNLANNTVTSLPLTRSPWAIPRLCTAGADREASDEQRTECTLVSRSW